MKIYLEIKSADDCLCLQNNLECFSMCCRTLGLKLNLAKCRVMTFSRSHNLILWNYKLSDTIIERVFDSILDLGFKLSSNLNPSEHISMICCKSLKTLGFILRFSKDLKLSRSLKSLYCALVRPILEYGLVIWNPYTATGSNQLQRV
uniref:RNA-directed DNA polymerase from mobile element jockey n=1 Tax=Sipha flava TaxID=143950 RepID=A0A2S2PX07_9HEMI